jgi:Protein of Unknown function (DUF2604)
MADPKIAIVVVVNGEPTTVEANPNAPLHTIVPKALAATGNVGQPPENWELRDADGNLLDIARKVESFGWASGIRLFLSLKAGIGG